MRAWTVDADDIHVAEDFDESLLHRTPEIDSFLTPDRDDKFIVIGTKGFGPMSHAIFVLSGLLLPAGVSPASIRRGRPARPRRRRPPRKGHRR